MSSVTSTKADILSAAASTGNTIRHKQKLIYPTIFLVVMALASLLVTMGSLLVMLSPQQVLLHSSENVTCFNDQHKFSGINEDILLSSSSKSTSSNATRKEVLEGLNICHADRDPLVGYFCNGSKYDEFADRLENMVVDATIFKPSTWGRRADPFPPNSTIIIMGNSHTRQVVETLRCQYISTREARSVLTEFPYKGIFSDGEMKISYILHRFPNNVTVHAVTNHYFAYSPGWQQDLEELIGFPLSQVDGIILGMFNIYNKMTKNTTFFRTMREILEERHAGTLGYPPPTVIDVSSVYKGPIVLHSMFTNWHQDMWYNQAKLLYQIQDNKKRIRLINGRTFVPALGECGRGGQLKLFTGDCGDDPTAHACTGLRGAHPDLVVWEILEAMDELLRSSSLGSL